MKKSVLIVLLLLAAMAFTACGNGSQTAMALAPVAITAAELPMQSTGAVEYYNATGQPLAHSQLDGEFYIDHTLYVNGAHTQFPLPIGDLLALLGAEGAYLKNRGEDAAMYHTLEELAEILVQPDTAGSLLVRADGQENITIDWYAPYFRQSALLACHAMTTTETHYPGAQSSLRVLSGQVHVGMHQAELLEIVGAENLPHEAYSEIVFLCKELNPRKQNDRVTLHFGEDGILQSIRISTFHHA